MENLTWLNLMTKRSILILLDTILLIFFGVNVVFYAKNGGAKIIWRNNYFLSYYRLKFGNISFSMPRWALLVYADISRHYTHC